MPLLSLWKSNPSAVSDFTVEQVVKTAGDGSLKDGSQCSTEIREYLSQIPSKKIGSYVEQCLTASFDKGGMVLQDLINELGRRLDYVVTNGLYQGKVNAVGFDGTWRSPEGPTIIAEVKTTDTYRISLDKIVVYRDKLVASGQIKGKSSFLIVVGRDDTGELEAQVRGSRHAWEIRLISTDALLKLVQLKENSDSPETGRKIRNLLCPMEYTRLDDLVDAMFTTATDVESVITADDDEETEEKHASTADDVDSKGKWEFTDSKVLQAKRETIVDAFGALKGVSLIKKSRALYWDAGHELRIGCSISKRYVKRPAYPYWYAFHPQWNDFLRDGHESYFILGCMDLSSAFALPWKLLNSILDSLNTTTTEKSTYWHIHLIEPKPNELAMLLPKKSSTLPLTEYRFEVPAKSA